MQTNKSERSYSMLDLFNSDNNRILDFRSLQELHAPLLQKIWTTPQE